MSRTWTLQGSLKRATEVERARVLENLNISILTDEEASFVWTVPTATVAEAFDFGLVDDAQMLALFTDEEVEIQLVSGGDSIVVSAAFIIMGGSLNELYITNNSGNTATVQAYIGGKAVTP